MKFQAFAILAVLVVGSSQAQEAPVNSPAYHAVHNPQSPNYVGPQQAAEQQSPQPTGYWKKTWGAIAGNPTIGILGSALGASSETEATQQAISDCQSRGGGAGCRIEIAYHNQCAVLVVGDKGSLTARAASIEEASQIGMEKCTEDGDSRCRVHYSACTEPIFHQY